MNLAKMQDSRTVRIHIPICVRFVWRQLESRVFRCGNSGCRTFYFISVEKQMNDYTYTKNQSTAKNTDAPSNRYTNDCELFKKALSDAMELKIREVEEKAKDI